MSDSDQKMSLDHGRALLVLNDGDQESVEIRDTGGALMLRVVMTPEGPVVQLEAARLELVAKSDISVTCERFSLHTRDTAIFTSDGGLQLNAKETIEMNSTEEVLVTGSIIRLN